ncbi:cytotoxic translational repressor of toxin-antitoxin stability system [bacterium]|nr:cytotoxic translational repressor of toxin-antitoxin stability system [bacterium]
MPCKTCFANKRIRDAAAQLPDDVKAAFYFLMREIQEKGPVRGDWPNYSKLGKRFHHCHLKKGKPTFVAVWEKTSKDLVAFVYVGTHEKVNYSKYQK